MKIGRFEIEQLSEGIFDVSNDGLIRKVQAENITGPSDSLTGNNRQELIGVNPLLIRDGKHIILIDTGLGWGLDRGSDYKNTSNLVTNLDIFGLSPEDVTHVVLSHLHFDHAAGSTFVDAHNSTQRTMPYANYFLQKKEWYYAIQQVGEKSDVAGAGYEMDELYKLAADDKLVMISDVHFELLPGIDLIRTGGHTPGHQIVKIEDGGECAYFLGDLIPSEQHLNEYGMEHMDMFPVESKKAKTLILRQALEEQAYLLFYHSIHAKAGRLDRNDKRKFVLKDIR